MDDSQPSTYELLSQDIQTNETCHLQTITRRLIIHEPDNSQNPFTHTLRALIEICSDIRALCNPDEIISLNMINENAPEYEAEIGAIRARELHADNILEQMNKISQSNRSFSSAGVINIIVSRVLEQEGRGKRAADNIKLSDAYQCLIVPRNNNPFHASVVGWETEINSRKVKVTKRFNNLCGLYAAHIGMEHVKKIAGEPNSYESDLRQQGKIFAKKIDLIMEKCGMDLRLNGMRYEDWDKLQNYFTQFTFYVHDGENEKKFIFKGCAAAPKKEYRVVTIILAEGHYSYCRSAPSLFGYAYICPDCGKKYTSKDNHSCVKPCYCCGFRECAGDAAPVQCRLCEGTFKTLECYNQHVIKPPKGNLPKCQTYKKCRFCGVTYTKATDEKPRPQHTCGEFRCKSCDSVVPKNHHCFMKKKKPKTEEELQADLNNVFVTIFDMECTQYQKMIGSENRYIHKPNLICATTFCKKCWNEKALVRCSVCGKRDIIMHNFDDPDKDLAVEFLDYCKGKARGTHGGAKIKAHRVNYLIAHCGGSYDHQFLMGAAVGDEKWVVSKVINRGRKIITNTLNCARTKLVLLDFYNFVPKSLANMCKAFNLDASLAKGSFPHIFNQPHNYNYCQLGMPDKKYWCPEGMKVDAKQKFDLWWDKCNNEMLKNGEMYDFKKEIIAYCIMDTKILHLSVLAFCSDLRELKINPILESCTIASLCMAVFERNFMIKNSIGIKFVSALKIKIKNIYFLYRYCAKEGL